MKYNFIFLSPCPLLRPRQQPRCLLSIFHAGVLGLQAQGSLHEKLKYLFASNLVGARPHWGRAHGMGAGGSPCQTGRKKRRLRRPPRLAGATDRAQFGWGRGGHASKFSICAPDLRGRRGLKTARRQIMPSALLMRGRCSRHGSRINKALGHRFLLIISTPLGVGGGLAGAMAAPSAVAPALGHQFCRGL